MKIDLVYTGRSYQLAEALPGELELHDGARLSDALLAVDKLVASEDPLPPSCLISISGQHVGTLAAHDDPELHDGDELVLIAPVAGG